jgi:hypothetical protein
MIADGSCSDKHRQGSQTLNTEFTEKDRRTRRKQRRDLHAQFARARFLAAVCYYTALEAPAARHTLSQISYDKAYPGIEILPRSRNWWAWLKGTPPECIHLGKACGWIATLLPDTLYLKGKRTQRSDVVRPEITLCRECLESAVAADLESFEGRVVAFEPDPGLFTQYFFVGQPDFEAAGLRPEVAQVIAGRLKQDDAVCAECGFPAKWLWLSREQVPSLDDVERIATAAGEWYCAKHGARNLLVAFARIADANIFYMNLPYGDAGAYVWI